MKVETEGEDNGREEEHHVAVEICYGLYIQDNEEDFFKDVGFGFHRMSKIIKFLVIGV